MTEITVRIEYKQREPDKEFRRKVVKNSCLVHDDREVNSQILHMAKITLEGVLYQGAGEVEINLVDREADPCSQG